jgi:putative addiction module component (TIGR02574 family)
MTQISKNIVDDALSLSTNQRVELVEKLLESLDVPNSEINNIWAKEADDRVRAYENNEVSSKSISEVLKKYK